MLLLPPMLQLLLLLQLSLRCFSCGGGARCLCCRRSGGGDGSSSSIRETGSRALRRRGFGGGLGVLRSQVCQHDMFARADAAGDGLADRSGTDDDDDVAHAKA